MKTIDITGTVQIMEAHPSEFEVIGKLLVQVYSQLEGFPKPEEQPAYYTLLANVGELTKKPHTSILVAKIKNTIAGAVVFFGDMQHYGSGGTATKEVNAAGFRLLAVDPQARGAGIGKMLTEACIERARQQGKAQVILHTTKAMLQAWKMYEAIGFTRSPDLDFMQGNLEVFGFRLKV